MPKRTRSRGLPPGPSFVLERECRVGEQSPNSSIERTSSASFACFGPPLTSNVRSHRTVILPMRQPDPQLHSTRRSLTVLAFSVLIGTLAHSQSSPMKPTQFVVVHSPGPSWKAGVPPFEQEGLQLHVAHYSQLLTQGKLVMGGVTSSMQGRAA